MANGEPNGGRISVSEDRLRAILAEFKLDLFGEVRDEVTKLAEKLDRIDREGSIGTKAQLADHEQRLRDAARNIQRISDQLVKREEIHNIRSDIAALNLSMAEGPELVRQFRQMQEDVEDLIGVKMMSRGIFLLLALILPILATISWHLWG